MPESSINRRDLLVGAAAVGLAAAVSRTARAGDERLPNESGPYDLVIAGGRVIDPETGLDGKRHVGIKGGASPPSPRRNSRARRPCRPMAMSWLRASSICMPTVSSCPPPGCRPSTG